MDTNAEILEKGKKKVQRIFISTLTILIILICIFSFALAENDSMLKNEKIEVKNANNLAIIILIILVVTLGTILLVEVLSKKKQEKINSYIRKAKKAAQKAREMIDDVEEETENQEKRQEQIKEQLKKARIHLDRLSPRERRLQEKLLSKRKRINKKKKMLFLSEFDDEDLNPLELSNKIKNKKRETFVKLEDLGKGKKPKKGKKKRTEVDESIFDELDNLNNIKKE